MFSAENSRFLRGNWHFYNFLILSHAICMRIVWPQLPRARTPQLEQFFVCTSAATSDLARTRDFRGCSVVFAAVVAAFGGDAGQLRGVFAIDARAAEHLGAASLAPALGR